MPQWAHYRANATEMTANQSNMNVPNDNTIDIRLASKKAMNP
jgi:hypothetical protein